MEYLNQTTPRRFILLGFSNVLHLQVIIFITFLTMYLMTISGNLLLIIIVRINPRLHSPMYFFLTSLSLTDIIFSSSIDPVILMNIFSKDRSISSLGCAVQMYISLAMGVTECVLLAFMAYDRYAAICRPLHYNTIMSKALCIYLVAGTWTVGFVNSFVQVFLAFQLQFCNCPNVNHYFCEVPAFIRMACRDTFVIELSIYITGGIFAVSSFCLILISYVHIISNILKIISSEGRQKSFSTCVSHLTAVILYYGTIMFMYLRPQSKKYSHRSSKSDNIVPIFYATVTPMLNPFIYSIRNKDVKNTFINQFKRKQFH
ncbi:olfactory receptor 5G26-like [Engystomops pustulosus]|uniref:olfactory receptor 5G26-like n=1 Tax=Engystomops pustulosus TaxID=76066 RepID=UPI003AFA90F4